MQLWVAIVEPHEVIGDTTGWSKKTWRGINEPDTVHLCWSSDMKAASCVHNQQCAAAPPWYLPSPLEFEFDRLRY
jgi:hypothetical protein